MTMNPDTVRINITLPTSLAKTLTKIAGPRKRSLFITEVLQHKIDTMKQQRMEASLIEGYTATKKEVDKITNDFKHADIEGWDEY